MENPLPKPFLKNGKSLYFQESPVVGADASSFRVLDPKADIFNFYAKDANQAYFFNSYGIKPKIKVIRCKDIGSFERLDAVYAKDNQRVYYKGIKLKGADPHSFTHVGLGYWKDNAHVYHYKRLLEDADAASFIFIGGNHFATDRINLYFYGTLANDSKQEPDVQTFIKSHMHLEGYWWNINRPERRTP